MTDDKSNDEWLRGFACAVATAIRLEGCIGAKEKDLMGEGGLTKFRCIYAGVDPYDMEVLFPERAP